MSDSWLFLVLFGLSTVNVSLSFWLSRLNNRLHREALLALDAAARQRKAMREALALWRYGAVDEAVDVLNDAGFAAKKAPERTP